jgi:hypothetical protein
MRFLNKETAIKLMIGMLTIVLIFHVGVIVEIIPYTIVWAGKIDSIDEMRVFEMISILINALLLVVLYIKSYNIKNNISNRTINFIIWVFVFLFAINTVGNLFARSFIELILGTGLTSISSLLCWIIVKKDE